MKSKNANSVSQSVSFSTLPVIESNATTNRQKSMTDGDVPAPEKTTFVRRSSSAPPDVDDTFLGRFRNTLRLKKSKRSTASTSDMLYNQKPHKRLKKKGVVKTDVTPSISSESAKRKRTAKPKHGVVKAPSSSLRSLAYDEDNICDEDIAVIKKSRQHSMSLLSKNIFRGKSV